MQFLNLYPEKTGLLIGINNGLSGAGSFFPVAWKTMIENEIISYSGLMWIWFGLSVISLLSGTIIYPWHNLPQDLRKVRFRKIKVRGQTNQNEPLSFVYFHFRVRQSR